jgi:hypothetical protein
MSPFFAGSVEFVFTSGNDEYFLYAMQEKLSSDFLQLLDFIVDFILNWIIIYLFTFPDACMATL